MSTKTSAKKSTKETNKVSNQKGSTKSTKSAKQETKKTQKSYKRGSLSSAIWGLIANAGGPDKVTYEEAMELALKVKPDSKFNKYHWSWYKNKWNNMDENEQKGYK